MRLAEAIFALARPTQGWVEQSPTVPKFSYSRRMPFSPPKKYCALTPVMKLVPLTWRPSLLARLTKPLTEKVNLACAKNATTRPYTERLLVEGTAGSAEIPGRGP